jgi:predicted Zn-dependent protease
MSVPAILTSEECEALSQRILSRMSAPEAEVDISSSARASTEFARGDAHVAGETRSTAVTLTVAVAGGRAFVQTNRLDEPGLAALAREAEALPREYRTSDARPFLDPQTYAKGPQIYFDATAEAMAAESQAAIFRRATDAAEAAGLIAAGDLALHARTRWVHNTSGLTAYERSTYGELSLTSRTTDGRGSGWAWGGYEDWTRVDVQAVIARAVDLARRSANPVAVEPGRYPVILEPAAVAALIEPILDEWPARWADAGLTAFAKEPLGTNKIGLRMLDRRLGMVSSPWDPERPASTIAGGWAPVRGPVTWFEQGVLANLRYDPGYAAEKGRASVVDPGGVRLTAEGAPTSLEEMIASTKRGIWVNRLSQVAVMSRRTLLLTGTTRDGTFLVENGKITKAIKNLRFTESPFFVLNRLEASGDPVRASASIVAPRLKLLDFDFTSLTDAV